MKQTINVLISTVYVIIGVLPTIIAVSCFQNGDVGIGLFFTGLTLWLISRAYYYLFEATSESNKWDEKCAKIDAEKLKMERERIQRERDEDERRWKRDESGSVERNNNDVDNMTDEEVITKMAEIIRTHMYC